ncbi:MULTISPECIES: DNA-binding protein [unclassified Pseudomonas]|uniref:DNA-binding protein n=1 Tax=unclassified Pseudomonas TaxID=196821 RepID=UPI001294CF9F|nr:MULTISPECIES: DNA-binding protein [unclassified Pseudomonas]MQT40370.1 integrase [Pseudomonas sp. FSL R10-0765]MQT50655.1 integrase [Pseudomonas sp. FSL R10-2398]MQU00524.1 integrase [Pseudomonas sp. FSL R10-2245]MQU10351.1 integrase [Pseudomonas sp. FSL R10-2189]MQU35682.1 integrase [Pseudomonas sp. FSL R10-2172]
MARGGVNKAVVQIARTAILARGEHPSIDAVRIEMGNTGSKTTIHRYLKELDETDSRRGVQQEQLGDELSELVARLAQRLKEQAQEPIDRAEAHYEQLKAELRDQLAQAQQDHLQLQKELDIQSTALQQETANLEATRSMLQTEQTRNAALNQACSDFELRLNDRDEQIRSLEEKHLHARDALEHYRSATKEQREQEQRRHEGQLQQLQMELRQAQQSALVRQDEITQLHRDNERVLSESRALSKELNQASDQQHKLSNLNERLTAQLNQQESERTLLQERLRVATQESQALKEAQNQALEANAALTLRALKAEAALETLTASLSNTPKDDIDL